MSCAKKSGDVYNCNSINLSSFLFHDHVLSAQALHLGCGVQGNLRLLITVIFFIGLPVVFG